MTIKWRHCAIAERDHEEDIRNYAHTYHYPQTICLAKDFWELPREHRDGILLHEIGHLLAGPEGSESDANQAALEQLGAHIEYVDSPYGRRLERLKNMPGATIIRRRSLVLNPIANATIASYRSVLRSSAPQWAREWREWAWGDLVRAALTRLERKYNERLSDEVFDELFDYGMLELDKAARTQAEDTPWPEKNPMSTSEWKEDFYRKGFDVGKKDQGAEFPMYSGDRVSEQAARMAGIAVQYHDLRPSKEAEVSNAFITGYYDGLHGRRFKFSL